MIQWTFLQRRAAATKSPVLRRCHFERKSPWWMQPPVDFKPSNVKLLLLLSPVLSTSSRSSFTVTHWLVGIVIIWFPIGFEVASLQQISSFWQLEYSFIERDSIITERWQWELLIPTCFLMTQICSRSALWSQLFCTSPRTSLTKHTSGSRAGTSTNLFVRGLFTPYLRRYGLDAETSPLIPAAPPQVLLLRCAKKKRCA